MKRMPAKTMSMISSTIPIDVTRARHKGMVQRIEQIRALRYPAGAALRAVRRFQAIPASVSKITRWALLIVCSA